MALSQKNLTPSGNTTNFRMGHLSGASCTPMGLSHHWRVFIELLSRELFSSPSMIKTISFRQFNGEEQVLVKE